MPQPVARTRTTSVRPRCRLRRAGPQRRRSSTDTATAFAKRLDQLGLERAFAPATRARPARRGRLAARLRADADAAARDETLARDKPANRGTVAAVSLNPRPGSARGLVVTRERTYTNGHADLGGARYRVYRVAISASHDGWTVTEWAPQP